MYEFVWSYMFLQTKKIGFYLRFSCKEGLGNRKSVTTSESWNSDSMFKEKRFFEKKVTEFTSVKPLF